MHEIFMELVNQEKHTKSQMKHIQINRAKLKIWNVNETHRKTI
jgi:hypothetical protein